MVMSAGDEEDAAVDGDVLELSVPKMVFGETIMNLVVWDMT